MPTYIFTVEQKEYLVEALQDHLRLYEGLGEEHYHRKQVKELLDYVESPPWRNPDSKSV